MYYYRRHRHPRVRFVLRQPRTGHSAVVPLIGPRVKIFDGLRLCPTELINSTVKSRMLPGVFWWSA